jgi:hypothetical protein
MADFLYQATPGYVDLWVGISTEIDNLIQATSGYIDFWGGPTEFSGGSGTFTINASASAAYSFSSTLYGYAVLYAGSELVVLFGATGTGYYTLEAASTTTYQFVCGRASPIEVASAGGQLVASFGATGYSTLETTSQIGAIATTGVGQTPIAAVPELLNAIGAITTVPIATTPIVAGHIQSAIIGSGQLVAGFSASGSPVFSIIGAAQYDFTAAGGPVAIKSNLGATAVSVFAGHLGSGVTAPGGEIGTAPISVRPIAAGLSPVISPPDITSIGEIGTAPIGERPIAGQLELDFQTTSGFIDVWAAPASAAVSSVGEIGVVGIGVQPIAGPPQQPVVEGATLTATFSGSTTGITLVAPAAGQLNAQFSVSTVAQIEWSEASTTTYAFTGQGVVQLFYNLSGQLSITFSNRLAGTTVLSAVGTLACTFSTTVPPPALVLAGSLLVNYSGSSTGVLSEQGNFVASFSATAIELLVAYAAASLSALFGASAPAPTITQPAGAEFVASFSSSPVAVLILTAPSSSLVASYSGSGTPTLSFPVTGGLSATYLGSITPTLVLIASGTLQASYTAAANLVFVLSASASLSAVYTGFALGMLAGGPYPGVGSFTATYSSTTASYAILYIAGVVQATFTASAPGAAIGSAAALLVSFSANLTVSLLTAEATGALTGQFEGTLSGVVVLGVTAASFAAQYFGQAAGGFLSFGGQASLVVSWSATAAIATIIVPIYVGHESLSLVPELALA